MKHWSPDTLLLYLWLPFHWNNYFQQFSYLSATSYFLMLCLYYALLVQVRYIILTSYLGGEDLTLTLCIHISPPAILYNKTLKVMTPSNQHAVFTTPR